jgi:hypothetical protein
MSPAQRRKAARAWSSTAVGARVNGGTIPPPGSQALSRQNLVPSLSSSAAISCFAARDGLHGTGASSRQLADDDEHGRREQAATGAAQSDHQVDGQGLGVRRVQGCHDAASLGAQIQLPFQSTEWLPLLVGGEALEGLLHWRP